jgi:hypothetical protein
MYDAKIASLRDFDYELSAIWELPRTLELQQQIWDYKCPQCWTPCEAYQTILGNLFGQSSTAGNKSLPPKEPATDLVHIDTVTTANDES